MDRHVKFQRCQLLLGVKMPSIHFAASVGVGMRVTRHVKVSCVSELRHVDIRCQSRGP